MTITHIQQFAVVRLGFTESGCFKNKNDEALQAAAVAARVAKGLRLGDLFAFGSAWRAARAWSALCKPKQRVSVRWTRRNKERAILISATQAFGARV